MTNQIAQNCTPAYSLAQGFVFEGKPLDFSPITVGGRTMLASPAQQVADALDYSKVQSVTEGLIEGVEKVYVSTVTPGGTQEVWWVTIGGVWTVIGRSRKKMPFRQFMAVTVMESVTIKGGYAHPEAVAAGVTVGDLAGPPPSANIEPAANAVTIPGVHQPCRCSRVRAAGLYAAHVVTFVMATLACHCGGTRGGTRQAMPPICVASRRYTAPTFGATSPKVNAT